MERQDFVNDKLSLIQETDGLTFGTDALLLAGYINGKFGRGCEFGSGSGIISMLLLTREKLAHATALEVQEKYADLTKRNAELNGLTERLSAVHTDLRDYKPPFEFDIIYSNPPYMKTDSGKKNVDDKKNIARHEVCGDIYDFCRAATRMLKFGGCFTAVYRTDRLVDMIDAMRTARLEPKRITFVHADTESEPSMALIEGKSGRRCGIKVTRPLIIYTDKSHREYTDDMKYIMENGSFPSGYKR
ncbi:MAG: methyltransferase [Clostridia bacterium]|nr:methyltransferase [Clostridia bacterium]